MAGARITRRKQTKKRDEIVTSGPKRGGYLRRDSSPIARNPKYGETGGSPGRCLCTGLSRGQLQQPRARQLLQLLRDASNRIQDGPSS